MIYAIVVLASFIAVVNAGCDNACSGHGTCTSNGICACYDNWGLGLGQLSGDCSQRTCPYEIAFVDSPYLASTYRKGYSHGYLKAGTGGTASDADDNVVEVGNFNPFRNGGAVATPGGEPYTDVKRHRYAECSGRGLCNRDNGECECFPGYEGKGCQRTTCPNDCSGHGRCAYIERMPYETTAMAAAAVTGDWSFLSQDAHTFEYFGWDRHKTRGCICDPEYGDLDCSKRMCPFGTDIMDQRNNLRANGHYEVQSIWLQAYGSSSVNGGDVAQSNFKDRTFALTFKSKLNETFTTRPIVMDAGTSSSPTAGLHDMVLDIEQALEELPNRVIDDVKVNVGLFKAADAVTAAVTDAIKINITFSGEHVQGPQNLLTVRSYLCGDGCTPKLSGLDLEPNKQFVSVGFVNRFGHYVQNAFGAIGNDLWPTTLRSPAAASNQPGGLTGGSPLPGLGGDNAGGGSNVLDTDIILPSDTQYSSAFGRNVGMAMSDYNSYECGRRGKCDYTTGVCGCFAGYTGIACGTITALV